MIRVPTLRSAYAVLGRQFAVVRPLSTTAVALTETAPANASNSSALLELLKESVANPQSAQDRVVQQAASHAFGSNEAPGELLDSNLRPAVTEAMRVSMRDDPLLSQLVNTIMKDGKKMRAQRFVAEALLEVRARTHADPYATLCTVIEQCSPMLKLVSTRKGSKNVPVPFPLNERQRRRRAIKWIIQGANKRSERGFPKRLASEIIAVTHGQSIALENRMRLHKEALAARSNVQAGTSQGQSRRF